MKRLSLFLVLIFANSLLAQSELWHAHDEKNATRDEMLKSTLSFILTQNRASAGLAFVLHSEESKKSIYQHFSNNYDYKIRIGENSFRSYRAFHNKMVDLSHEIPRSGMIYEAKIDALIRTSFYFKQMKQSMSQNFLSFDESFNNIQISDYKKSAIDYSQKAKNICQGNLEEIGFSQFKIPRSVMNFMSIAATSKNCAMVINDDLLEIVNPYNSPLNGSESSLEGTSIYLVKKLIPNRNYENNDLFREFLKVSTIRKLNPYLELTEALNEELNLNSIDTIRLINLANHNHGLEFFMLNAIIDLSEDDEMAIRNVNESYRALNTLYDLINKYYEQRKKISNKTEDRLPRPYHFWGGALISCELLKRDYPPRIAKFMSEKLGEVYEVGTRTTDKNDIKESNNDILLHELGAKFGVQYCK